MRILIAGAGVTGRRLAAQLAKGRHDVTVVDLPVRNLVCPQSAAMLLMCWYWKRRILDERTSLSP